MTPTKCLACDGENLHDLLDLGLQPLANNYDTYEKYPLGLEYCEDCYHAQLTYFVDPEKLYRNYYYVSGTSNTLRQWFSDFAVKVSKEKSGTILDVASNDGSLLLEFLKRGWSVRGVDPAENLETNGIPTENIFFDKFYRTNQLFDVITAFNVLAHGPNPLSLLKGIYNNLKDDGVAYVMTSQGSMFENGQFDTVYHEHHSFFCLKSFQTLANRAGFTDISYTVEPIHGGSLLFKLTKSQDYTELPQVRPDFEGFKAKVNKIEPYSLVGYGAAAKGVVTINKLHQRLDYIIDESPLKIGKLIPGTQIPIMDTTYLASDSNNLIIIIYAWNFYDEIVGKIKSLRPDKDDIFVRYFK